MLELIDISYESLYIAISAVIAVFIWLDGSALRKNQGKLPKDRHSVFQVWSIINTLWLPISLLCLYLLKFQSIAIVVPIVYCVYKVFGLFYATSLISQQEMPKTPEDIVIPKKLVDYTQSFSVMFFILCLLVLLSMQFDVSF